MFIPSDPTPIEESVLYKSFLKDQERRRGVSFDELVRTVEEQKKAQEALQRALQRALHDKDNEIRGKDDEIRRLLDKLRRNNIT